MKTKVSLALNDKKDTADTGFFKYQNGWVLPNDKNRQPFSSIDQPRFQKLLKMSDQSKHMNVSESTYSSLAIYLMLDTSNDLNVTLIGFASLMKRLLCHGFSYSFPGNFQSGRLEEEFGIYRQLSDGCYYISLQQIMNSFYLLRIKLCDDLNHEIIWLNIELSCNHIKHVYCIISLTDEAKKCLCRVGCFL